MKRFVRILIAVIVATVIIGIGGVVWIWYTLYPKPLPTNPWEVPAVKTPGNLPSSNVPRAGKEQRKQKQEQDQPPTFKGR